jgi:hypothetical protein
MQQGHFAMLMLATLNTLDLGVLEESVDFQGHVGSL